MSYPELIARHRKLAPELALSLAPTLSNLLEGRLSAGDTYAYLRELEIEEEFENVMDGKALRA